MGAFIEHIVAGLAFTLLGLWHTINTTKVYKLHGPSNFTSTTWFPFPKIKHLELHLILVFSLLAIVFNLFNVRLSPLSSLEHACIFLHFAIFAATALAVDLSVNAEALAPLVGALAASAFGQELFLLHFHDHGGLEGHYHWLLQVIVAASFAATITSVGLPSSFAAAIIRSMTITCQGLWFAVIACSLWLPSLLPEGCHSSGTTTADDRQVGAVRCPTEDAAQRAVAVANLQFSAMVVGASILTTCLSLRTGGKSTEYSQLEGIGMDVERGLGDQDSLKQEHASV